MDVVVLAILFMVGSDLWLSHGDAAECVFTIPSVYESSSGDCTQYDLTSVASQGPYKLSQSVEGYSYMFSLCGDVNASSLPKQCSSLHGTAFQYNDTTCYSLGSSSADSTYVYRIHPQTSSNGIRVVYGNGDNGTEAIWPRAIILDLMCDMTAPNGKPTFVTEFPTYTYKVLWRWSLFCNSATVGGKCPTRPFDGTWDTVRFRPKPTWFDEAKFGIFIHWGVFSVPSFKSEWYWKHLMSGDADYVNFHNRVYGCSGVMPEKYPCDGPTFEYADFAPLFKAELFDPDKWADLFKNAGAKYVVLTSKHHEGWCNYPSSYHWNWNSVDEGPHRDLVGDLTASVRAAGLHMGLYHSLREWYNPLYLQDNQDNCSTTNFPDKVLLPTLKEMVMKYKPEVIWSDGDGDSQCTRDSVKYWKSPEFLSWLYNDSPVKDTVMANSRFGNPAFGDYQTGGDRFTPGMLLPYKWESCYTIQDTSWGYDRTGGISDFHNASFLLMQLASSVSCNGNLLLNVGPTADGRILPVFEETLLEMGQWLNVNGEAIYNTTPWRVQNDTAEKQTWYTASKDGKSVYAISFVPPVAGEDMILKQPVATDHTQITILGYSTTPLKFSHEADGLHIQFPLLPYKPTLKYAWTYKLIGVL